MRTLLTALLLGSGSFLFFLAGISNPPSAIFDERSYVDAGSAILSGAPDPIPVVPPLGKLLIASGIRLAGNNPLGWRLPSALFGALALAGIFLFLELLLGDYSLALAGSFLALLNNFLYVLSRTAMVDVYIVSFAVWGLLAFLAALKFDHLGGFARRALLAFSGILLGFAVASKWNGVDELAVVILLGAILLLLPRKASQTEFNQYSENLRKAGIPWFAVSFLVLPVLAYASTFWLLDLNLHIAFSPARFVYANYWIWRVHSTEVGNIGLNVPWYKWPLKVQPTRALSYLVGNWYVMWAGLVALLYCFRRFARNLPETLVVSLYVVNMLQWAVTPQHSLFYYYYFCPAIFLGIAIPVALHRLPESYFGVRLSVVSLLPAFCVFVYCFAQMAHLGVPYDSMLGYWP